MIDSTALTGAGRNSGNFEPMSCSSPQSGLAELSIQLMRTDVYNVRVEGHGKVCQNKM